METSHDASKSEKQTHVIVPRAPIRSTDERAPWVQL